MQYGLFKGKIEQKSFGWDKSNQKVHRGINVFSENLYEAKF